MRKIHRSVVSLAAAAALVGSLAACGGDDTTTKAADKATDTAKSAAATATDKAKSAGASATDKAKSETTDKKAAADQALVLTKSWTRATTKKMTGSYGMLKNTSDKDITLVGGTSPAAGMIEMHEIVTKAGKNVMQKVEGGLVIPAGDMMELKPGDNHIMLMKLKKPLAAGDKVTFTLKDDAGKTYDFTSEVREATAKDEPYDDKGSKTKKDDKDKKDEHEGHDH